MTTPTRRRATRVVAALAALAAADAAAPHLPNPGHAGQLAFLAVVSLPLATLAVAAGIAPRIPAATLIAGALAGLAATVAAIAAGHPGTPATLGKLVIAACLGMLLASMLSTPVEVVAIALLIAAVDIYSVAAGPTHVIVSNHPGVLDDVALNLHVPGAAGVAQIGTSDLLFFALFTAATVRLGLRRWTTWAAMTASFGVTFVLADHFDLALPALPLLSLGFLAANADVLWARRRGVPVPPNGRA